MATSSSASGGSRRENTTKTIVADQISQAVLSISNILHLMQQSSPAQAQLVKLPKSLLAKAPTIENTGKILEQMPHVISSLDAHMEKGSESVPHLQTVVQLLTNMESTFSLAEPSQEVLSLYQENKLSHQPKKMR